MSNSGQVTDILSRVVALPALRTAEALTPVPSPRVSVGWAVPDLITSSLAVAVVVALPTLRTPWMRILILI